MNYKSIDEVLTAFETGKDVSDLMAGVYAFGHDEVDRLLKQAHKEKKQLIFYYANASDEHADVLSYKMEKQ